MTDGRECAERTVRWSVPKCRASSAGMAAGASTWSASPVAMALIGHARVFGRFGPLHHHHARLVLNRFHPQRSIRASAGQDDADCPFPLVVGQRPKEIIDRQPRRLLAACLHPMNRAVEQRQVSSGRADVNVIRRKHRALCQFADRHRGMLGKQFRQQADMTGMLVRHDDQRHAEIDGHVVEQLLQRFESAGRSAHADYEQLVVIGIGLDRDRGRRRARLLGTPLRFGNGLLLSAAASISRRLCTLSHRPLQACSVPPCHPTHRHRGA